MNTALNLTEPTAKFRIGDREPLFWLVAALFTDQFWQRDSLTSAKLGLFGFGGGDDSIEPAKYRDWPTMYRAVEEWVVNDPAANACFTRAKEAITAGEFSFYSPDADEWGEKPYHAPERDVDSYEFLQWAEKQGYPIGEDVVNAVRTTIHMAIMRKSSQEQEARAYPTITAADFEREQKRPLWTVGEAIMFVMGRRSRSDGKEAEFGKHNRTFERLLLFITDAEQAQQLKVLGYDHSFSLDHKRKPFNLVMLEAKVEPAPFVAWVKKLSLNLPMLQSEEAATAQPVSIAAAVTTLPTSRTPEMELMFAAMEHFWSDYPRTPAPLKKIVVAWLTENAGRYGIEKLSVNLAEAIDTILRPADARAGGLKGRTPEPLNPLP